MGSPLSGHKHPLRALLTSQFLGAFNDNAFQLMVALLMMRGLETGAGALTDPDQLETARQVRTTWAFVVFTVPLMLFSLPAGALADRYSKRSVLVAMKLMEVALMTGAVFALVHDPADPVLPLVLLGLMALQSALYSPAKYGILPELVPHEGLSTANGLIEMWTVLAVITGTAVGGLLLDWAGPAPWVAAGVLSVLAVTGWCVSWRIPRVPARHTTGGVGAAVSSAWAAIKADRTLRLAVMGLAFFWGLASLVRQDVLVYTRTLTDGMANADAWSGAPLGLMALGVGVGSVTAARMSAGKVEVGLIPLGAVGMAVCLALLGLLGPAMGGTLTMLGLTGFFGGLILVPTNALLQWRAPAERRGAVIALSNVFLFGGVLAGSLVTMALALTGLSARSILVVAAALTIAATVWAIRLLPQALLRLVLVLLTHSLYRLRVVGRSHMPETGGVLLVPNHVSLVDGLFLMASVDRRVRFIVDAGYMNHWLLRPFFNALDAIPISPAAGPKAILSAFRKAGRSLDRGEVVCIFAEGQITRTGMLLPFRRGLERIIKGRDAVVMPVNLDRVWGSLFSHSQGRFITKIPKRIPYPVTVVFGEPLAPETPIHELRRAVHELSERGWRVRKPTRKPLHRTFIRAARRHPLRMQFGEAARPSVSRLMVLTGMIALGRKLRKRWEGQQNVGILLPPSIGGALANMAAAAGGRTSVNLNYTAGTDGMTSACKQAALETVVTSKLFLKRAGLQLPEGVEPIWLDELAAGVGVLDRLKALATALFAPARLIEKACGARGRIGLDDTATIIFSSGSTGDPKGVMLSHYNVDSNVDAVGQVLRLERGDKLLGVLPLFHSFGYMALWTTCNLGAGIVFHPNPLDATAIGELVHHHRVTIMLATPTFLQMYMRRCTPGQFGSLRLVVAGAEKLNPRFAEAFEDHFGLRPLEGYGTTECSPVVAVSVPDYRAPGFFQPGARRGFVGQPLPGVAVRIVDPDSFEPLPPLEQGMLLVRGPNVMQGYLGRPDLTREVMHDGWYVTGDIAYVDEDGFLRITDRLARFSKIGGEMVPHGKVEEELQKAADEREQVFAVTAVPDERKGERLAVLHTLDRDRIPSILQAMKASGLPNLFIPRPDHFVPVDALPVLGTGKLDLRAIKAVAREHLGKEADDSP